MVSYGAVRASVSQLVPCAAAHASLTPVMLKDGQLLLNSGGTKIEQLLHMYLMLNESKVVDSLRNLPINVSFLSCFLQ